MALPCIEILHGAPASAYSSNPTDAALIAPSMEVLSQADGAIACVMLKECSQRSDQFMNSTYYGIQVEDPKHAYVYNGVCPGLLYPDIIETSSSFHSLEAR